MGGDSRALPRPTSRPGVTQWGSRGVGCGHFRTRDLSYLKILAFEIPESQFRTEKRKNLFKTSRDHLLIQASPGLSTEISGILSGGFDSVCNHGNHRNAKQDAARVKISSCFKSPPGCALCSQKNRQHVFQLPPVKWNPPSTASCQKFNLETCALPLGDLNFQGAF